MTNHKLSSIGEYKLIDNIKKWTGKKAGSAAIGIGDDTAMVRLNGKILVSIDTMVERVHFNREYISFYDLGWKVLAINVSDISAMGGIPKYALVSCAVTNDITVNNAKEIYRGISSLADKLNVQIIGGDTVSSKKDLMITITIVGECAGEKPALRGGAKNGDYVCVTGFFGDAAFGRQCVLNKIKNKYLIQRFNCPAPRVKESVKLVKDCNVTSMMDVSDGLVSTLNTMAEKSLKKFEININDLPISKELKKSVSKKDALKYAMYGGEDYELVFTVPKNRLKSAQQIEGVKVIGCVKKGKGLKFIDDKGKEKKIKVRGYEAF
ncbi:MAG: thiamine-phosphate kinase [Elusimicrobiota bacterium]